MNKGVPPFQLFKKLYFYLKIKSVIFKRIYKLAGEITTFLHFFIKYFIKKTNKPLTKFIIFSGSGRVGSTLLYRLLNSHPQIHCEGEILERRLFSLRIFIKIKCALSKNKIYGFELYLEHLRKAHNHSYAKHKNFISCLHKEEWKIIYLERRNILHQAISKLYKDYRARNGKRGWHEVADGPYKLEKIHIDCDKLMLVIKAREARLEKAREIVEDLPHITVVYEDGLLRAEDHQGALDRIFSYLGVPSVPVKAELVRLTSDRLSDFVQNYEEVIEVIGRTKYAKFLLNS